MNYSVVVATRNRLDALKLSLPLLLAQTRPPLEIIVVDSTDAPEPIRGIVEEVARTTAIPVSYLHSAPGASLQRNLGLARARGAVTLFPDDNSMFFPDAMERVMRIYERDSLGQVGGVCASEIARPPAEIAGAVKASYARAPREAAIGISAPRRKRLKSRFVSDPFRGLADRKYAALAAPDWLTEEDAILVSHMTGFRMSFRTELIRRAPFDEDLGRYALFEDVDASLRILDSHCLVGARRALVYHHKVPGRRDAERALGVMQILNRAYVLSKHQPLGRGLISRAYLFCFYKLVGYGLGLRSRFGRDRLGGALSAYRVLPQIFAAPPEQLAGVYRRLRARCLDA